jgi:hypothetical protein
VYCSIVKLRSDLSFFLIFIFVNFCVHSGREVFVSQTGLIHWRRSHAHRRQVKSRRGWVSSWNTATKEEVQTKKMVHDIQCQ